MLYGTCRAFFLYLYLKILIRNLEMDMGMYDLRQYFGSSSSKSEQGMYRIARYRGKFLVEKKNYLLRIIPVWEMMGKPVDNYRGNDYQYYQFDSLEQAEKFVEQQKEIARRAQAIAENQKYRVIKYL